MSYFLSHFFRFELPRSRQHCLGQELPAGQLSVHLHRPNQRVAAGGTGWRGQLTVMASTLAVICRSPPSCRSRGQVEAQAGQCRALAIRKDGKGRVQVRRRGLQRHSLRPFIVASVCLCSPCSHLCRLMCVCVCFAAWMCNIRCPSCKHSRSRSQDWIPSCCATKELRCCASFRGPSHVRLHTPSLAPFFASKC